MNHVTNVYFENFSEEVYKEILLERLKPIKKYYLEKYGIKLNFSDDVLNKISKELLGIKSGGARNIGLFTKKLYAAADCFKRKNHITESYKKVELTADVVYDKGSFMLLKK